MLAYLPSRMRQPSDMQCMCFRFFLMSEFRLFKIRKGLKPPFGLAFLGSTITHNWDSPVQEAPAIAGSGEGEMYAALPLQAGRLFLDTNP